MDDEGNTAAEEFDHKRSRFHDRIQSFGSQEEGRGSWEKRECGFGETREGKGRKCRGGNPEGGQNRGIALHPSRGRMGTRPHGGSGHGCNRGREHAHRGMPPRLRQGAVKENKKRTYKKSLFSFIPQTTRRKGGLKIRNQEQPSRRPVLGSQRAHA